MDYVMMVESCFTDRPTLVGMAEIGERIGRSRQRIQQLAEREDFPAPYQTLRMGRVWLERDIDAWLAAYRPG